MAHTIKTCLHGNNIDTCKKCPHPLNEIEIETLLFANAFGTGNKLNKAVYGWCGLIHDREKYSRE